MNAGTAVLALAGGLMWYVSQDEGPRRLLVDVVVTASSVGMAAMVAGMAGAGPAASVAAGVAVGAPLSIWLLDRVPESDYEDGEGGSLAGLMPDRLIGVLKRSTIDR